MGGGREVQEVGDMCIFMAELCCMEKDNTYCKAIIFQLNFKECRVLSCFYLILNIVNITLLVLDISVFEYKV